MLREIENALYEDDPDFVSSVRSQRLGSVGVGIAAVLALVLGLVLLVGGLFLPVEIGPVKIVSLLGFLVMLAAGMMVLRGNKTGKGIRGKSGAKLRSAQSSGDTSKDGLMGRMEERFNRRFE